MRGVALLMVLGLVAALASCGSSGSEPGDRDRAGKESPARSGAPHMGAAQPDGTTFDAQLTVGADGIEVTWELTNDSGKELLVADLVPSSGTGNPDTEARTVYVTEVQGRIELSQRVFDWPDTDDTFAVAPRVGVTRLAAGDSIRRSLTVPLPVQLRHPFGSDFGTGPRALPSPPTEVEFCLGVIAPPFHPALQLERTDGTWGVNHGVVSFESQHVFCSAPSSL